MTQEEKPLNIAIAGLGTVGCGLFKLLDENRDLITARAGREINVVAVSSKNKSKDRGIDTSKCQWASDACELPSIECVDVVVELIGGANGAAKQLVEAALSCGKPIVSANKALIATHGLALAKLSEQNNAPLLWEAAVAGGIPIIKALREGLSANSIQSIFGILNGTCNYILSRMEESGDSFEVALKAAQELGYAEADPSFDIGGVDAGHKLALLAALAFGVSPDIKSMPIKGIEKICALDISFAKELNYTIRLLGTVEKSKDGAIIGGVEPCLVPKDHPMSYIKGAENSVMVESTPLERSVYTGQGAGAGPTASAVAADIIDIARKISNAPTFGIKTKDLKSKRWSNESAKNGSFYLRLSVMDKAGVIAKISHVLKDENISIESLLQHGHDPDGGKVQLVMTTHEAPRTAIIKACAEIEKLDVVLGDVQHLRII